jgi:hypothetical protein
MQIRSFSVAALGAFALALCLPVEASALPGAVGVVDHSARTTLVQRVGNAYPRRYYRKRGSYVCAPFTEVDTRRGTWVRAPFARVYSDSRGTWVRAPFVNLWAPRD